MTSDGCWDEIISHHKFPAVGFVWSGYCEQRLDSWAMLGTCLMLLWKSDFRLWNAAFSESPRILWRDKFEELPLSNIGNALVSCRFSQQNQAWFQFSLSFSIVSQ
jgi:hypothetical protein